VDPIHQDLATQWEVDLVSGLDADAKSSLLSKYRLPPNLSAAKPPQLNIELKSALPDASIKRDIRLEQVQSQMGLGLAALGKAQTLFLATDPTQRGDSYLATVEAINDAVRILADVHHEQSIARQHLACISLDSSVKDLIPDIKLDGWLFGANLLDRVKNAKALVKSSLELKARKKTLFQGPSQPGSSRMTEGSKNFKRPSRAQRSLEGNRPNKPYNRKKPHPSSRLTSSAYQKFEPRPDRFNSRRHR